jgi:hypothetical protein
MRAALYWVPALDDPLYQAGVAWLGRDAETAAQVTQPAIAGIAELTADPRRYGLHATLRPPMRLATGWEEFRAAAQAIASVSRRFFLPPLELCDLGGFIALRSVAPSAPLRALADRCVTGTERHRLRPDAAELARRRAADLSARQDSLLEAYGYPYVLDEWVFHVTLTRRLDGPEMARMMPCAAAHFAPVLALARAVEDVAICTELGRDFRVAERLKFKEALLF